MSSIEFFLTANMLVAALALARLLEGIFVVSESPRRYWVHTVWLFVKVGNIVVVLWGYRLAIDGQLPQFEFQTFLMWLLNMAVMALVFLQALALTGLQPRSEDDWEARFYSVRVRFFVLNAMVTGLALQQTIRGDGATTPAIGFAIALGVSVLGASTASRRVHAFIAIIVAANMLLSFFAYAQGLI